MEKKRFILVLISLLAVIFCFSSSIFAETIILKSGEKIEGKIIERTDIDRIEGEEENSKDSPDNETNEIKITVNNFFSALIERDIEQESLYFDWENLVWGLGPIGKLLSAGYKSTTDEERQKMRTNFLSGYNDSFLTPREEKLKRKMIIDDFEITSAQILSDNRAVITYSEPFAKDKEIYLRKKDGKWFIYEMEKAESIDK